MRKVLIIGATSAIAEATARLFAQAGDALFLVGRNKEKLMTTAEDLRIRGASRVLTEVLDVSDFEQHDSVINKAIQSLDGIDLALLAHGTLPDQDACEQSFNLTKKEIEVNAISMISFLTSLANYFEQNKAGTIAVISSVAGDRGRQSNYIYGSAKGMVTIFLQGLRNRLYKSNVNVITIKPGFVDTPMTSAFEKGLLWSTPDKIAKSILTCVSKNRAVCYVPAFWYLIMLVIKLIPEWLFKRMSL